MIDDERKSFWSIIKVFTKEFFWKNLNFKVIKFRWKLTEEITNKRIEKIKPAVWGTSSGLTRKVNISKLSAATHVTNLPGQTDVFGAFEQSNVFPDQPQDIDLKKIDLLHWDMRELVVLIPFPLYTWFEKVHGHAKDAKSHKVHIYDQISSKITTFPEAISMTTHPMLQTSAALPYPLLSILLITWHHIFIVSSLFLLSTYLWSRISSSNPRMGADLSRHRWIFVH